MKDRPKVVSFPPGMKFDIDTDNLIFLTLRDRNGRYTHYPYDSILSFSYDKVEETK